MANIIDGKRIAEEIQQEMKAEIMRRPGRRPCLVVVLVGEHPPSMLYVEKKTEACREVGIQSIKVALPAQISEHDLLQEIHKLNIDPIVDGILLQLPLPHHLNPNKIIQHISPTKDVDGLHPENAGKLLIGDASAFAPCTPKGVQVLLMRSHIEIGGKHAVVIGRSNLVGKPMATLLMQNTPDGNATVTIAHSRTSNLPQICQMADIVIAAIGQPFFVTADMIKEGATVIDVGINKISDPTKKSGFRIVGDVDFEKVAPKCSYITPVPGGVGPMTIAMLLSNTLKAHSQI